MTDEAKKYMYQGLVMGLENDFELDEFLLNNFENARKNGTLISSLEEVISLNKKMNRSEDFGNFVSDFFEKIQNVESVLYTDTYFRTNTKNSDFLNCLKDIKDQFKNFDDFIGAYKSFNVSNEILADNETLRKESQRQRVGIKLDKSLSPLEKTLKLAEANALYGDRSDAVKVYIEARNEQEKKSKEFLNSALNGLDKGAFLETCRLNINNLDSLSKNLAIADPETRDKLGDTIRELRDVLIRYRNEYLSCEAKYNEILHQVGFKKRESSKEEIEANIAKYKQEIESLEKSEEVSNEIGDAQTVAEPTKEAFTLEDLISELKRLNPEIDVIRDGDTDGILTEDPSKLVLPEGFKYTEGLGVNNKKNDIDPYISAFVKTKEKTLDSSSSEKTNDAEKTAEPAKEEVKEPKKESHVPRGRLEVKRTRRAIVAPYVKAILCYGALGGVMVAAAGVGLSAIGTGMIIGAGVGVIGQKIYHKMINSGAVEVPNADFEKNSSYEIPVVGSYILKDAKSLLQSLRKNKNKKKAESLEESPAKEEERKVQEQIAETVNEIKDEEVKAPEVTETVAETEDKKDVLYETYSSILSANLDREVEALDKPEEVNNQNLNIANIPIEQYQMNSENSFDYDSPSRGGR